jgi:regulatory protein
MPTQDAVDAAVRVLSRRDRSEAAVRRLLERKGVSAADAAEALDVLRRIGAVDDSRFAERSAEALARRGFGDAAIAERLEREGLAPELAADAVARLEPEAERAAALAEARGRSVTTARWLAARGHRDDSIDDALRGIAGTDINELG